MHKNKKFYTQPTYTESSTQSEVKDDGQTGKVSDKKAL